MTNTSSSSIFKRASDFLAGGYNVPKLTDAQLDGIPLFRNESVHPSGFRRFMAWIGGGYNMPTKAQVDKASNQVVEKVSYPTGFFGWLAGGFNNPVLKK